MKKLLCLILICCLLCACSKTDNEQNTLIDDEQYLVGIEPSAFNLNFEVPSDAPLAQSPSAEEARLNGEKSDMPDICYSLSSVVKKVEPPLHTKNYIGSMQSVFVRMKNLKEGSDKIDGATVLNFQLFSAFDFVDGTYLKLYKQNIPFKELENRIIYQTEDYVAVDVTDYMLNYKSGENETLQEHISRRWPDGHPDAQWAISVRDYYVKNLKSVLE